MAGGAHLQSYFSDINAFVTEHGAHPELGAEVKQLGAAQESLQATTMLLLSWFYGGRLELVPLHANRFLEMMAETTVSWLLLQQGVLAHKKSGELPEGHRDLDFYAGKLHAALYFVRNVLPGVKGKADILAREDHSAMRIPEAAFAQV
jgi:acyl-CoA dehydrogenase